MKSKSIFQISMVVIVSVLMVICAATGFAQPPKGGKGGKGGGKGDDLMTKFDANKDGKIEKSEWTGPPNLFTRLDKNKNGVIEKKEVPDRTPPAGKSKKGGKKGK